MLSPIHPTEGHSIRTQAMYHIQKPLALRFVV